MITLASWLPPAMPPRFLRRACTASAALRRHFRAMIASAAYCFAAVLPG